MILSGNKGEWSEIYVFFRLLAQGRLYAADSDLNRIDSVFYEILRVLRSENVGVLHFIFQKENSRISVVNQADGTLLVTVPADRFKAEADLLLSEVKRQKNRTFEVETAERFLNELYCTRLKAPAEDKADIKIQIHDVNTGYEPLLGFSVKSRLGQPSTLLNPGKTTNFLYEVVGNINDTVMNAFNTSDGTIKDRFGRLFSTGCDVAFLGTDSIMFGNNLMLIDSDLPVISAHMLIEHYALGNSNVMAALGNISIRNPLRYNMTTGHQFYHYKFMKLLTESALGMLPSKVWTGRADATGGYIIVREDGEVLCYHLYNRNEFEEYLLKNTKFDTASTGRYEFASIYKDNGRYFIKLNMQIRFIK